MTLIFIKPKDNWCELKTPKILKNKRKNRENINKKANQLSQI